MHPTIESIVSAAAPPKREEVFKEATATSWTGRFNLALSSLTLNVLSLALPVMTLQVYDRILAQQSVGTLRVLVFGVCVVFVLDTLLRTARSYMMCWTGAAFEHKLTCRALDHLLSADLKDVEGQGAGQHTQDIASIGRLREFISGQAFTSMVDLPFVIVFLALIVYLSGPLVLVPLTMLAVFCLSAWLIGIRLKSSLSTREAADDRRMDFIVEMLRGIHTIKSLGLEAFFLRRYERLQGALSRVNYEVATVAAGATNIGVLISHVMMVVVTAFGASMVIRGELTMGALLACILLSGRIIQPVQRALGVWIRFQNYRLAKDRVNGIFSLPKTAWLDGIAAIDRTGRIDIVNVSFGRSEGRLPLLSNVNLSLPPGYSIAIGGEDENAKSTLLQLMAGLYRPSSGSILIDDMEATHYPAELLAEHVGYLPAHGIIFQGTIRDNLTGFDDTHFKAAEEIVELLGMKEAIAKLPRGYDTKLNDGPGDPIPPGLKQCIAIARVLANKPRLLLFDNAEAALDKDNYNHLFRLLGRLKGRATLVIVSDDRNFLGLAQDEYMLEGGKLKARNFTMDAKFHDVRPHRELRL